MRFIAFAVYDGSGNPLPSATPSFLVYSGKDNNPRTAPAIVNMGGGVFGFTIPTIDVNFGVAFFISTGAAPAYIAGDDGGIVQAFALYDSGTLLPVAGKSPSFATYVNSLGGTPTPPPIVDFGSGLYAFVPGAVDYAVGVAFEINCGAGVTPARFNGWAQKGEGFADALPVVLPPANIPQPAPGSDAFARLLRQLLPPGKIWNLEPSSTTYKTLQGLADELSRVSARGADLTNEYSPDTALETLSDWERVLGLPDKCLKEIPTGITERRTAVVQKYTSQGGQTPAYFIALAAQLGYVANISYYQVCRSGSAHSGDRIYDEAWAYAWLMTLTGPTPISPAWALSGQAHSGDRIQGFAQLPIECVIQRYAPAHTIPLFAYTF